MRRHDLAWIVVGAILSLPPQGPRREPSPLRRATLAVEVDSHVFARCFESSEERVRERLENEFLPLLNGAFTPCTGLVWELGPLVIWKDAAEDPYTGLVGKGHEIWGRFASRWSGKESKFNKAILFYGEPFGFGGLGGGRYVLVGDPWGAWCHEISHCFGNPHGGNGSIEHGSMSNSMDGRLFRLPARNPYSHTEVDEMLRQIERERNEYPVIERFEAPVAPYARIDVAILQLDKQGKKRQYIDIDVLGNDQDVNGDELKIGEVDPYSRLDGEVEIIEKSGKALLRYTPLLPISMPDSFSYTVVDEGGLSDRGNVLVQVIGTLAHEHPYEICCVEGEGRRCLFSDDDLTVRTSPPQYGGPAKLMRWKFVEAGSRQWKIVHQESGHVLAVDPEDRHSVALVPDSSSPTCRWRVKHDGGPLFTIQSVKTREFLSAPADEGGFALVAEQPNERKPGYREQRWGLSPILLRSVLLRDESD